MRVKCFAQEHITMTRPGLEPGPLDPDSSALTTKPPRLPLVRLYCEINPSLLTTKMISGANSACPSELATCEITKLKTPPYDVSCK